MKTLILALVTGLILYLISPVHIRIGTDPEGARPLPISNERRT